MLALLLTGAAGLLRGAPDNDVRVLLDADSVRVGRADAKYGVPYLNASVGGREHGCLGCPLPLFASYLADLADAAGEPPRVQSHALSAAEFWPRRDVLQQMWQDRRLVLGSVGGLTDVGFADSLVALARTSPRVHQPNASAVSNYHVGVRTEAAEYSGTAMLTEMRALWPKVDELAYVKGADEANKKNAQEVLKRVKQSFEFYRARCLAGPKCDGGFPKPPATQTSLLGTVACTPEDAAQGDCVYAEARRCESGSCGHAWAEFPRFHGLGKLMQVQRGRCSELSRVAYGMYLALGYDARMVIDFTDHVWAEVRLPRGPEGQWFHADPSEAVFDRPLMYEKGWGKKLTFVFGVTPRSVEDVSARYTADHAAMVQRRGLDEAGLQRQLATANHRIQFEQPMQQWGYSDTAGSTLENVAVLGAFI